MDKELQRVIRFIEERDWSQFHNPKDLAISLSLEAAELLEHFQWKNQTEIDAYLKEHKGDVAEELVDVLYWVLLISHYLKIDLSEAFDQKMTKNDAKYPVSKAKGKHDKYTAYQD